jgi:flagellar hook-associated protein 3 FlgL
MPISRVSDAQTFALVADRAGSLQARLRDLQEQIASGRKLTHADQDPIGAAGVVRHKDTLAALAANTDSSKFGTGILAAQDDALGESQSLLVRAEEIATQQASGLLSPDERAAAKEEVRGLLDALTALGNQDLAGRRLFGGLALDTSSAPFATPPDDLTTYDPTAAYTGSAQEFELRTGSGPSDRVRISTAGGQVFTSSLQALHTLWTALNTGSDPAAALDDLATGRATLAAERASVGVRQGQLVGRTSQLAKLDSQEQEALANVRDADLIAVISQVAQLQTALQATLSAGSQIARTSLADLLPL